MLIIARIVLRFVPPHTFCLNTQLRAHDTLRKMLKIALRVVLPDNVLVLACDNVACRPIHDHYLCVKCLSNIHLILFAIRPPILIYYVDIRSMPCPPQNKVKRHILIQSFLRIIESIKNQISI